MTRRLPARRLPARRLLLLAALLVALSWHLAGIAEPDQPVLSLVMVAAVCGAWVAGLTGAVRVLAVERSR